MGRVLIGKQHLPLQCMMSLASGELSWYKDIPYPVGCQTLHYCWRQHSQNIVGIASEHCTQSILGCGFGLLWLSEASGTWNSFLPMDNWSTAKRVKFANKLFFLGSSSSSKLQHAGFLCPSFHTLVFGLCTLFLCLFQFSNIKCSKWQIGLPFPLNTEWMKPINSAYWM